MTSYWTYWSPTLKVSLGLTCLSAFCILFAFSTPWWLVSIPDESLPNPKFEKLGLWAMCLNGYHDRWHQYDHRFYGCMHIWIEEYWVVHPELSPPFFVVTQVFFTLAFTGMLLTSILISMYLLCINDYYRVKVLKWISVILVVSALFGLISLIVFAIYGDARDYMPNWENNFISTSFYFGFIGVFFQFISGILFWIEGRIVNRKEQSNNQQEKQQFEMERERTV